MENNKRAKFCYQSGLYLLDGNKFAEAIDSFNQVIDIDPNYAGVYTQRGAAKEGIGDWQGAMEDYNSGLDHNSNDYQAYGNRGILLMNENKMDLALDDFDSAINLEGNNAKLFFLRSIAKHCLADIEGSNEDFIRAKAIDPDDEGFSESEWEKGKRNMLEINELINNCNEELDLHPQNAGMYYKRGQLYRQIGNHSQAIEDYTRAIEIAPNAELYLGRGIANQNLNKHNEAIADFSEAIKLDPNSIPAYGNRGATKCKIGDLKGARVDFSILLELDPNDAKGYFYRADVNSMLKEYKCAISDFSRVIELEPTEELAYHNLGLVYMNLADYKQAITCFDKYLTLRPNDAITLKERSEAFDKLGKLKGVEEENGIEIEIELDTDGYEHKYHSGDGDGLTLIEELSNTLDLNPNDIESYLKRGVLKYQMGQNNEALEDFSHVIELDKDNAIAYNNRGVVKHFLNDEKGSIIDLDMAITLNNENAITFFNRGLISDGSDSCLEDYTKVIELCPTHEKAYYKRGVANWLVENNIENAIQDFKRVIELNRYAKKAYYDRGKVLKSPENVIENYDQLLIIDPHDEIAYYNRGQAKYDLDDFEGAISDFSMTLEINPSCAADPYFFRGISNFHLQNLDEAKADFTKSILVEHGYNAYCLRAELCKTLGDFEGAMSDFGKAIEQNKQNAKNYLQRGILKYELNDIECALSDIDKGIKLTDPDNFDIFYEDRNILDDDKTIADYTKIIELRPDWPDAYFIRALARYHSNEERDDILTIKDAVKSLAIRIKNQFDENLPNVNILKIEHIKEFIENLIKYLDFFEAHDPELIQVLFDEMIAICPEWTQPYLSRGWVKSDLGDFTSAIVDFSRAIGLSPTRADIYFDRGEAKYKLGDFEGAKADFNQAVILAPNANFEYYDIIVP